MLLQLNNHCGILRRKKRSVKKSDVLAFHICFVLPGKEDKMKKSRIKIIILILLIMLGMFGFYCFAHWAYVASTTESNEYIYE